MQTFLPYPLFSMSLECLDNKRLSKQRVEAMQIYNVLTGKTKSKAWQNHPAVKMWKGYEKALACYHNTAIHVWKKRGYKNTMKLIPVSDVTSAEMPPWMGNDKFHLSHMSNLLRKDPIHYREFSGYGIPNDLPYIWPTKEGMM